MSKCNGSCSCKVGSADNTKKGGGGRSLSFSNLIEMVAHQVIHIQDEYSWRCRLCEDMGRYTRGEIVEHLRDTHAIPTDGQLVDAKEGAIFISCDEPTGEQGESAQTGDEARISAVP